MPVVLAKRETDPTAVFCTPIVLDRSDPYPIAVLSMPIVLAKRETDPTAVFCTPVVLDVSD